MFSDVPGSVWNERHRHIPVRPFRSALGLSNHQRARLLLGWRNEPVAGAMRLGQRPEQPLGTPLKNRRDIYRISSVPITASAGRHRREAMPISVSILVGGARIVLLRHGAPSAAAAPDGLKGTLAFRIGGVAGHHSFALDRRQRHRDCCHICRNHQTLCPATGEPMKKKAHS